MGTTSFQNEAIFRPIEIMGTTLRFQLQEYLNPDWLRS